MDAYPKANICTYVYKQCIRDCLENMSFSSSSPRLPYPFQFFNKILFNFLDLNPFKIKRNSDKLKNDNIYIRDWHKNIHKLQSSNTQIALHPFTSFIPLLCFISQWIHNTQNFMCISSSLFSNKYNLRLQTNQREK